MMFHKKGITMKEAYKFKEEALETAGKFQRTLKKGEIAIVKRTDRVEGYPYEIFFERLKKVM
jgi:hypothetical protein